MHSRLPYTWTSPSLWHSPSAGRVLPISQRGCWSANCSLVSSSWATGARSIPVDLSTSLVNGTCPKARVEGRSTPELVAASAPVRHPVFLIVVIVSCPGLPKNPLKRAHPHNAPTHARQTELQSTSCSLFSASISGPS